MRTFKNIIILFAAILLVSACSTPIDLDLEEADPKVVIEGLLLDDSIAIVKVSKTQAYLDNNPSLKVTDAFITLADNVGNLDTLIHLGNGVYKNDNLTGVTGRTYTLKVTVEGVEYTAQSLIPTLAPIDSLSYIYKPQSLFEDEGYYPIMYMKEPQNELNYYLWKFYRNDTLLHNPTELWVSDDKYLGENVNGVDAPYAYQLNDVAKIEMYSLTKEGYEFYLDLVQQLNNDGGFFSTPPANTRSNFSNGALGLFQTSTLEVGIITIQ